MSAGFLALLDDVASLMSKAAANSKIVMSGFDDIATMTGLGVKGASAVVIDDIPVNAKVMAEFTIEPAKEIPLVSAIERGSMINKAIAIPLAMIVNIFAPWLLTPILAVGGAYLAYEGSEKVFHAIAHKFKLFNKNHVDTEHRPNSCDEEEGGECRNQEEFEKNLVKGAIRTDLVMSIEITFIALAEIADIVPEFTWAPAWVMQLIALIVIGFVVTKLIYGLVKALIKMDDAGLHLISLTSADHEKPTRSLIIKRNLGLFLIRATPNIMKSMSVLGTGAMLFIAGELLAKQFTMLVDMVHHIPLGTVGHYLGFSIVGLMAGAVIVPSIHVLGLMASKLRKD